MEQHVTAEGTVVTESYFEAKEILNFHALVIRRALSSITHFFACGILSGQRRP
jgi:hypothetical protein